MSKHVISEHGVVECGRRLREAGDALMDAVEKSRAARRALNEAQAAEHDANDAFDSAKADFNAAALGADFYYELSQERHK